MKEMWKVRKGFIIAICLIIGIPLISYGAWDYHRKLQERAFAQGVLLGEIAGMGFYTDILKLMEEGREETAKEMLKLMVTSSAEQSRDLVRFGARIDGIPINLLEGVRDTKAYAEQNDLVAVVEQTTEVIQAHEE
jgi:hypothetical protein